MMRTTQHSNNTTSSDSPPKSRTSMHRPQPTANRSPPAPRHPAKAFPQRPDVTLPRRRPWHTRLFPQTHTLTYAYPAVTATLLVLFVSSIYIVVLVHIRASAATRLPRSQLSADHLVQALGKVPDVVAVQPGHRDASVLRQVDVRLLRQRLTLFGVDTCETATPERQPPPSPAGLSEQKTQRPTAAGSRTVEREEQKTHPAGVETLSPPRPRSHVTRSLYRVRRLLRGYSTHTSQPTEPTPGSQDRAGPGSYLHRLAMRGQLSADRHRYETRLRTSLLNDHPSSGPTPTPERPPRRTAPQVHYHAMSWHAEHESSPEHANLIDNVIPIARRLQLLSQKLVQLLAHLNDPSSHRLDIAFPFLEQVGVVEDQRDLHTVHLPKNETGKR